LILAGAFVLQFMVVLVVQADCFRTLTIAGSLLAGEMVRKQNYLLGTEKLR
jgi:hypothetical protein